MPGRGRFWNVGSLNDEIVEEADLTQALQTKVNAGGGGSGNWEVIADFTVASDLNSHTIPFSRTVATDGSDVSKVVVIIDFRMSAPDPIEYLFNGLAGTTPTIGIELLGLAQISETGSGITTDKAMVTGSHVEIIAQGLTTASDLHGIITETGDVNTLGGTYAAWRSNTDFSAGLSSIQIRTGGGADTINIGTKVTVYAVTKN